MRKKALFLLWLLPAVSFSQQSTLPRDKDSDLRQAFELFDKEKFGAAQRYFVRATRANTDQHSELRKISEYYTALCAVELFNRDAEYLLTSFIYQHPESPLVKQAHFQLGKFFFRDKKYKKALEWFKQVEPEILTEDEQSEFHFKYGYSFFKADQYDQALAEFAVIKDGNSSYATTATYYYGHMQYQKSNYETALEHFKKLTDDELFGPVVPFYISQIYYLQRKYDQVILYAQPILDSTKNKRGPEIAHLIGDSYYNTNRYKEAIPYLEKYQEKSSGKVTREDEYQLGYAHFKVNAHTEAIPYFEKAVGDQDAMGQNAWYHLGWCYLQTGNKKFARNAWQEAAKSNFDTLIKEQALFDYAKLSYELGNDPYDEAVRALQDYINKYPGSTRMDEAYTFLANIYATTHNYRTALLSLDRINKKTDPLKSAYQRVAYYRGLELLNDKDYPEAIKHFNLSLQYPQNKDLSSNANYWKADAQFRNGSYAESVKGYQAFVFGLNAYNLKHFNRVNYNLGYSYYKLKDYTNASIWFRKYVTAYEAKEQAIANDAFLRIADCYYVQKNYTAAVEYYDKAIALKGADTDYALFQKGMAQGVGGKLESRISALNQLLSSYPNSKYAASSKWELGRAYDNLGRDEEAYAIYNGILLNHKNSPFVAGAMLQMAGIRYNQKRDDEARDIYLEVVNSFPGSPEVAEAQYNLKRIYLEQNKVEEYQTLAKDKGFKNLSETEADSAVWELAENEYLKGNCESAIGMLDRYIKSYPQGIFSLNALGYKANCELKNKQIDDAALTYAAIIKRPKNQYTAEGFLMLGIYERQKENYPKSIEYFRELEANANTTEQTNQARINLMRLSAQLNNSEEAIKYAGKLDATEKINDEVRQEARLLIARGLMAEGKEDQALDVYQKLQKVNSEIGAESRFTIAQIYHNKGDYKRCEKAVFELVEKMPSYDYWLAKGFILLADNYVKLGNIFQAKQTLQSVIDNHEGAELKSIAQQKLELLIIQEQQKPAQELEEPGDDKKNDQDE
jgi:TolA-binding protein